MYNDIAKFDIYTQHQIEQASMVQSAWVGHYYKNGLDIACNPGSQCFANAVSKSHLRRQEAD